MKTAHSHLSEILPVEDIAHLPENEIGEVVSTLVHFHSLAIPFPPRYVIPASFLQEVGNHNQLFELIEQTLAKTNWQDPQSVGDASANIQLAIPSLVFPARTIKLLAYAYLSWWENHFVTLQTSYLRPIHGTVDIKSLPVKGEANIVESLLHLWASLYTPELLPQRHQEWQRGQNVPAAFLVEQVVPANISGTAYSVSAGTTRPHTITILSRWGIQPPAGSEIGPEDHFEVDDRTWNVTRRQVVKKTKEYVYQLDALTEKSLPKAKQQAASLNDRELAEIAKLTANIAQKTRVPVQLEWAKTNKRFYILNILAGAKGESEREHTEPHQQPSLRNSSATKVYVAVGTPNQSSENILLRSDGIGLLRSEFLFTQLGVHPVHLINQKKQSQIINTIIQAVQMYQRFLPPHAPIFFCSANFTSQQLLHFSHGDEYESMENNPFLGYRGAVRLLRNLDFFDLELEALVRLNTSSHPIHLLVPFVRTPSEMALLYKHMQKRTANAVSLWMQCNTPENILQISNYAQTGVAGFSIDIQNIHALLHGISPEDPDIFSLYPLDVQLMETLLRKAKTQLATHPQPIILQLDDYHHDLVRLAVDLGYTGVTVKPPLLEKTKTAIAELEHIRVNSYA